MKYKTKHVVEYILFRSVAGLVAVLPLRVALGLAWLIAAGTHFLGKVNVERTHKRIREVFGDQKTEKDIRRIAWIAWRNLCFSAVEQLRFPKLTLEKIRKQPMAGLEGTIKEKIAERNGQGMIMATPHYGNWEMAGVAADLAGIPLFVLVRKQKNPLMDAYINKMRRAFSMEVLYSKGRDLRKIPGLLKSGKVMAILPDVNQKRGGIAVDFLNGRASIPHGAALFARQSGSPVYPAFVRRVSWTKHDARLGDPICPDPDAEESADQQRIMQELMAAFSEEILNHPEQYFWYNKRWVLNKN